MFVDIYSIYRVITTTVTKNSPNMLEFIKHKDL